jgi:hypothetical protein
VRRLKHDDDGIGSATAAVLVAKMVDIERFPTPESLVGYFGVFPEENSSGVDKHGNPLPSGTLHMSRKGNDLARITSGTPREAPSAATPPSAPSIVVSRPKGYAATSRWATASGASKGEISRDCGNLLNAVLVGMLATPRCPRTWPCAGISTSNSNRNGSKLLS